jgi:type I restriction-modification system DNA methylase subunit
MWKEYHMSQATLGSGPYRNSNLFSGYYLDERVSDLDAWDCDAEAEEAFEQIRDLWDKEGTLLPSYNEDELIDTWIADIVDILRHGTSSEVTLPDGGGYVDRLLFENDEVRREGAKRALDGDHEGLFSRASAILEAKQWDADFEQRFSEQRSYRDASHQIKYYLERTASDLKWGVLTDGKKWRLYGTKDYETQTYYEVDLPEILESGDLESFKYFFAFFRPEAFVEHAGSSFLDEVWTESETAAQELGEDLQDNVFRALRVLGKGFVESNDLDVGDDGDINRDELKEQSLVLLYRLMFVLYAESRGLIDPDDLDASEEYHEYFSLESKREEILDDVEDMNVESGEAFTEEYSRFSSSIWGRLSELFELIDKGEKSLDIPPYNGGLFSRDDHAFLDNYEVKDPYIAEVIYWLSTTENDEGEHVPADYADLDTRHLGSIYEGLLEHEFRIADAEGVAAVSEDGGQVWKPASEVTAAEAVEIVEEGGLYVVNDEGERKATGAYYTPDYVVTYIVEETVDPLIDEIDGELREQGLEPSDREYFAEFWQEVKDLTILDPAMGSGHFLTKATGYLTEQVMEVVREQEIQSYDEQYIRREISKECIYGVDLNGMAVELSKLSMWLETLAADQPLAFLDHHLKTGNSLVGSDITEVLSEDGGDDAGGQLTLTQAFARVRQDTLEHVMELMADLLAYDNETLDDVKSMEELYDEIRADPLYTRLFELANVHTAEEFGCDVPEDAYEQMAGAIEDEDDWAEIREEDWFTAAQATADEQDFFHWELEFPEVFFDAEGEKISEAGFDAVMGNPPYVFIDSIPEILRSYLKNTSSTWDYRYDLYGSFTEFGHDVKREKGTFGYIIPHSILNNNSFRDLRQFIVNQSESIDIIDFTSSVFKDASNEPMILLTRKSRSNQPILRGALLDPQDLMTAEEELTEYSVKSISQLPEKPFLVRGGPWIEKILTLDGVAPLGDLADMVQGLRTGNNTERLSKQKETTKHWKALHGEDISRYHCNWSGTYVLYDRDMLSRDQAARPREEKYWKADQKILVQEIRNVHLPQRIVAAVDSEKRIGLNTTNAIIEREHVELDLYYTLAVISSTLINSFFRCCFVDNHIATQYLESIPLFRENESRAAAAVETYQNGLEEVQVEPPYQAHESDFETDSEYIRSALADLARKIADHQQSHSRLNTDISDYLALQSQVQMKQLSGIGLTQPVGDPPNNQLEMVSEDLNSLRVGTARVNRESPNTVLIEATARYKPDDEDAYETDQWDYTETEYLPAFRTTDLTEREADLIEHFVPVAVDEAGGFANFRETATKTNSLIDRLKAIELPDVDDVSDDLENYLQTKERAEELDEKIEQTDALIDKIVYELYGLTDEEIEIVEEAITE